MAKRNLRVAFALTFAIGCASTETANPTGDEPSDREPGALDPIEFLRDGTVEVGLTQYASPDAFFFSEQFRAEERRCQTHEPDVAFIDPSDCSFNSTTIEPDYQPGITYEIPVVFHIISRSDGQGFISTELIQSQVDVLNEDFLALAGTLGAPGTNTTVRFVLASTDPEGNPTSGINYHTNDAWFTDPGSGSNDMKQALAWDTKHYFNIYTNDAGGALGYATFPQQSAGTINDGVVLLWTSVGRNSPQGGIYDLGRTATHEVGHYLGLFHTFQGGCGSTSSPYSTGDKVADTQSHSSPNFDCEEDDVPSTCGGGNNPIRNYMNYTPDACMNRFSAEQTNRLRCSMIHYRKELYRIVGEGENQAPIASFTSAVDELAVDFTDTSVDADGDVVSWAWSFGDGGTSSAQNPSHTYAADGSYPVTLVVTDDGGLTATATKTVTIGGGTGEAIELVSGEVVEDIAAPKDGTHRYYIDVAEGTSHLSFVMAAGLGDADIYVRFGEEPTLSEWDYRPYTNGSNETVDVATPQAGRWHVMIHGYTQFSDVSLTANVVGAGGGTLLINEIMADPGTFDSNGDGTASYVDDEYLEIVNIGTGSIDLSGARLSDAVGVRFTFPAGTTLGAGKALVVFGGGNPAAIPGVPVFASPLQLNNTGDSISIHAAGGTLLAAASFGREGGKDQSLVRSPDKTDSPFVEHKTVSAAAGSPGKKTNGTAF